MAYRNFLEKRGRSFEECTYDKWVKVPLDAVPKRHKKRFLALTRAAQRYATTNCSLRAAIAGENLSHEELRRVMDKVIEFDENGIMLGHRAFIPYLHRADYTRIKQVDSESSGFAGAFSQHLEQNPEVKELIDRSYLREGLPVIKIHHRWTRYLKEHETYSPNCYPFCVENQGYSALVEYCRKLGDGNFRRVAHVRGGRAAGREADHTQAASTEREVVRPFEEIQIDTKKIEAIFELETHEWDELPRRLTLSQPPVVFIIDRASRAILGWHFGPPPQESYLQVAFAMQMALVGSDRRELTIPGLSYKPGAGYPADMIPACQYHLWDLVAVDNAKVFLSTQFQECLVDKMETTIALGCAGTPQIRGVIEKFNDTAKEDVFVRLPSTTGSGPHDPKRRDPEGKAIEFSIHMSEVEEILDVHVANRNATTDSSTGMTPLEYIRSWYGQESRILRTLRPELRDLSFLFTRRVERNIGGSVKRGVRPHVSYMGIAYRNPRLAEMKSLIRTPIVILVDMRDLRTIRAFLPNGESLGVLTAAPPWDRRPHSERTRRVINRLKRKGRLDPSISDPIDAYLAFLAVKAKENKRARNEIERVRREMGISHVKDIHVQRKSTPKVEGTNARNTLHVTPPPQLKSRLWR